MREIIEHIEAGLDAAAAWGVDVRRHLARHPELSWQEHRTQAYLRERLSSLGLECRPAARTGLVCDVGEGEPMVLYRADMDALPIDDPRRPGDGPALSEVSGVSHACGHDLHCAIAASLAKLFADVAERLPGRIRFVFQPAEEVVPSGAEALVGEGVCDDARACFALHADPMRFTGQVGLREGVFTAAGDPFRIEVIGVGGHSSRPYLSRDAILAAARVVEAVSTLVPQRIDPLDPAVLSVGSIHGGSAPNVIAGRVTLQGTIRTFSETARRLLHEALVEAAKGAAASQGCSAEIHIECGAPSLVNDSRLHRLMVEVVTETLGRHAVEYVEKPSTGGEDFSYFGTRAPIYMMRLGVRQPGTEPRHLHTAGFDLDEAALPVALRVMSRALLRALSL